MRATLTEAAYVRLIAQSHHAPDPMQRCQQHCMATDGCLQEGV